MKKVFVVISLLLCFFSCSSYKTVISPVGEETFFEQGREYSVKRNEAAEIVICNERNSNFEMVYYVEITNLSDSAFLVNPATFYYLHNEYSDDKDLRHAAFAVDPEIELNRIEKRITEKTGSHESSQVIGGACAFSSCLVGGVQTVKGDHEEASKSIEKSGEMFEQLERDQAEFEAEIGNMKSEYDYWSNEVLRKTTLFSGKTVTGFVHFNSGVRYGNIVIHFPVGKMFVKFEYKVFRQKLSGEAVNKCNY